MASRRRPQPAQRQGRCRAIARASAFGPCTTGVPAVSFARARARNATRAVTRSTAAQLIRAASGPYRPPQLPHVRQLAVIGSDEDELDVWITPTASPGPFSLRWIGFRQLMCRNLQGLWNATLPIHTFLSIKPKTRKKAEPLCLRKRTGQTGKIIRTPHHGFLPREDLEADLQG